jgi:hypothetical protein
MACSRCKRTFRPREPTSMLCPSCVRIAARLASPLLIRCTQCKRPRVAHRIGSRYCAACWARRQRHYGRCTRCARYKQIRLIARGLCAACHHDQIAARALRRYLSHYTCRFLFNRKHFNRLTSRIDWSTVREKHNRRLRYIGNFLEEHELPSPLTWESLISLMPPLRGSNRNVPKQIRRSLLEIGHLAAERGEIEPYVEYLQRRAWQAPMARAPQLIQPLLNAFADWLVARQSKPSVLEHHLRRLEKFWHWSFERSITQASGVSREHIGTYLAGLYWRWQCDHCGEMAYCADEFEKTPRSCARCQRTQGLHRVPRYRQNTVRQHRATLFTFFEWARLTRRTIGNPVMSKVAAPAPTIQHYPPQLLQQIGRLIAGEPEDATAALMLYLIVFHLATVQELRYLRLPHLTSLATRQHSVPLSTDTVLLLPKRQASLGIAHPGRPGGVIRFHPRAQPWLTRLLIRVERERTALIGPRGVSRYLFVSPRGALRDAPVCHVTIWKRIRETTRVMIGMGCNPNTLRKTAAIYMADRVGPGMLSSLGLEAQQAFAYSWHTRELMTPDQSR